MPVQRLDAYAIDSDRSGQFATTMLVSGRQVPVLVDTGATYVTLTAEDAATLGLHPADSAFRYAFQTANGTARAAPVLLPEIRVGNVSVRDVQAFVSQPGALTGQSLLGMSFLRKLSGFEIQRGQLVLKQ